MPFNGSGTFNRLYSWVVDAANNVNISSSRMDAEINGMAAALTNCITRDGQSPPSANLPMGGLKITNLGAATTGTDALNLTTADARYVPASGAVNLTLTGALNAATGAFSGNVTVGGTLGVTGASTFTGLATFSNLIRLANMQGLQLTDASGGHPLLVCDATNIAMYGTDATGANVGLWLVPAHTNSPSFGFLVTVTGPTPSPGDNSTKFATTAFVGTAITNAAGAPLNSPAFTGTPTAPTAAAGTATTQLATTAFADVLRDVPSNLYTTSQTVGAAHRGQGADFNGTSLTATIASGLSNGYTAVITNLNSTALTIASAADTLTWAGTTSTGSRTLAQNGVATVRKVNGGLLISGVGLS